ncbi:hypothetical protein V5N11_010396 [Cardamine amara subsp. amara]|uniref:Uncharacterized protein n=1 Tax=Cardamine amara subsp. amara TaxID=228776 RepID=A0ABD0ZT22_CARAN
MTTDGDDVDMTGKSPSHGQNETPVDSVARDLFGVRLQEATVPQENYLGMSQLPAAMAHRLMPEKFDGKGFKTWQNKMLFYMSNLNCEKFLKEDPPIVPFGNKDAHLLATVGAWKHADFMCRGWILGRLIDPLFQVYSQEARTSKELWMGLEKKYKSDDAGGQKFSGSFPARSLPGITGL